MVVLVVVLLSANLIQQQVQVDLETFLQQCHLKEILEVMHFAAIQHFMVAVVVALVLQAQAVTQ
jgi:hypothetical protein